MDIIRENDFKEYEKEIIQHGKRKQIAVGDTLLLYELSAGQMIYVESGLIVSGLAMENGSEHALAAYGAGTIIPFEHKDNDYISSITLNAKEETVLDIVPNEDFQKLIITDRRFEEKVYQNEQFHLNYYLQDIANLLGKGTQQRLIEFLQTYINHHQPVDNIIPISQKELAQLMGVNTVNMSRNMATLRKEHILMIDKRGMKIVDLPKLMQL